MNKHISFTSQQKNKYKNDIALNSQTLYLLDASLQFNLFEYIPRLFTITTNTGASNFNIEFLKDTSAIISEFNKDNPNHFLYHINIKDDRNVLGKFEQMYQGKLVIFDEDDISIAKQITKSLKICCCPNYIRQNRLNFDFFDDQSTNLSDGIIINQRSFKEFLKNDSLKTFKIVTKKKEYKCSIFGIHSSKIIHEIVTENQSINEYFYDYDDEFGEFQFICDLFNFQKVNITVNNMNFLNEISKELKIESISQKVQKYIENYEKNSDKIDKLQNLIDSIDELFNWLYQIKELTVESVKNLIIDSIWSQTEENVQELAAFILQAVNTDIQFHQSLIDLLIQLDKESNETNKLKILIPFIVTKLFYSFGKNNLNCSFVYKLFKKGFISKEEIQNQLNILLKKINNKSTSNSYRSLYHQYLPFTEANLSDSDNVFNLSSDLNCVISWFLPEIIEMNKFNEKIIENSSKSFCSFIKSYFPNKIDDYIKMRNNNEPDDEIIKALRNDDVDSLQSFISTQQDFNSKSTVSYNIFDSFVPNGETNFLNYSAAYGSIKCFKYLLLNHVKCDESTFGIAVYGGNIEIIKIVDQNIDNNDSISSSSSDEEDEEELLEDNKEEGFLILNKINPSILKHQNRIFDWIFETKFLTKNINMKLLNKLVIESVMNGNAHSLIEIIDNGFDLTSDDLFQNIFKIACENGFYRLSEIVFRIFNNKNDIYYFDNIISSVSFGNLSIFKYYLKMKKSHRDLEKAFLFAVLKNHRNIIQYFFDNLVKEGFLFNEKCVFKSLNISVVENSNDLFFYLIDQFNQTNPFFNLKSFPLIEILSNACSFGNFEVVKMIIELIIKDVSLNDVDRFKESFTQNFIKAVKNESFEICQYFIDKKVPIDFGILSLNAHDLSSLNEKVFSSVIENCDYSEKVHLFQNSFESAIEKHNYNLVEYLLKEKVSCSDSLIRAVEKNDLKMVELILKYKKEPSLINKTTMNGTALCIAVKQKNIQIVKTLLSIPDINPNLCDQNRETPLILSLPDVEMMNLFLDFYGESIHLQTEQILSLIKKTLNLLFSKKVEAVPVLYRVLEIKNFPVNEIIENDNFLTYACKVNNADIAKMILSLDNIDVNVSVPKNGDTLLIIAIRENSNEVAELLIEDKRTNVNARNYKNETALMIAALNQQEKIIDALLNNEKFDPIESRLDDTFLSANSQIQMKIISSKSFDINHTIISKQYQRKFIRSDDSDNSLYSSDLDVSENSSSSSSSSYSNNNNNKDKEEIKSPETILQLAVRTNDTAIIDFVIQHPFFDKEKSCLKKAIFIAIKQNNIEVFRKLFKQLINDDNKCDQSEFLSFAAFNGKIEIIKEILNDSHFYCKETRFFDDFCKNLFSIENQSSYEIMKILYSYDKDHGNLIDLNKLSTFGETVFTSICSISLDKSNFNNITEIVTFLLEKGADPNIPNKNGKYPLQHSIELNSIEFVTTLINSKKIDFSKRIKSDKNKTFLHLAAESTNPLILKEFLDRKVIDVNSVDDLGETSLMYACRFNRKANIDLLFQMDDLDYLHCNNKGENALKIVQDPWIKDTGFISSKDNFHQMLLVHLNNQNGPSFENDTENNKIAFDSMPFMNSGNENSFTNGLQSSQISLEDKDQTKSSNNKVNTSAEKSPEISKFNSSRITNKNDKEMNSRCLSLENQQSYSSSSSSSDLKENRFYIESLPSLTIKSNKDFSKKVSSSRDIYYESLPPLKKKSKDNLNANHSTKCDSNPIKAKVINSCSLMQPKAPEKEAFSTADSCFSNSQTEKRLENEREEVKKVQMPTLTISGQSARLMMNKIKYLQKLSKSGDAEAQYSLGVCYSLGKGVAVNKEKAFEYYLMSAEQGNMNAQYTAASCYSYGKGTEVNKKKAFELYLKAAEQGYDKAQFAVGHFYEFGEGGAEKNHDKALEWYKKAASQGHRASIKVLNNK